MKLLRPWNETRYSLPPRLCPTSKHLHGLSTTFPADSPTKRCDRSVRLSCAGKLDRNPWRRVGCNGGIASWLFLYRYLMLQYYTIKSLPILTRISYFSHKNLTFHINRVKLRCLRSVNEQNMKIWDIRAILAPKIYSQNSHQYNQTSAVTDGFSVQSF